MKVSNPKKFLVQIVACFLLANAGVVIVGYALSIEQLYTWSMPIGMALSTAFSFFAVGIALWIIGTHKDLHGH